MAAATLTACGSATHDGTRSDDPTSEDPASELVAQGIVMQSSPDARVELCIGPVAMSYPPQCGGPGLLGAFSWDDVQTQEQGGVRWSDASYVGIGAYDREADTFTLTRPLSTEPPPEFVPPTPADVAFPQLCEDPFRDGDPSFGDDMAAQDRLQQRAQAMDGYVTSWVSDGVNLFNVVVTGDPEDAHSDLREVWRGGLCVAQRDLPTADRIAAAQGALMDSADDIGLLTSGAGVEGILEVGVLVADADTTSLIRDIVSPWVAPHEVRVLGSLSPLPAPG